MSWTFNSNYFETVVQLQDTYIDIHLVHSTVYDQYVVYFLPHSKIDLSWFPFKLSKELHPELSLPYYYIHPCMVLNDKSAINRLLQPFNLKAPDLLTTLQEP